MATAMAMYPQMDENHRDLYSTTRYRRLGSMAVRDVDTALAAACAALDLPLGMGPAIFAIGRSAGWVAHVLEQYEAKFILRPRARFVGESPVLG
jgi:citrate synthase